MGRKSTGTQSKSAIAGKKSAWRSKTLWLAIGSVLLFTGSLVFVLNKWDGLTTDHSHVGTSPSNSKPDPTDSDNQNPDSSKIEEPSQEGVQKPADGPAKQIDESAEVNPPDASQAHTETGIDLPTNLPIQRRRPQLPIANQDEIISKTENYLREQGELTENDSVQPASEPKKIGNAHTQKLQQMHKGIPIYGAETIVIWDNEAINEIENRTLTDIDIDVRPKLTYSQTLALANATLTDKLRSQTEGKLFIYKQKQHYVLCWQGLVADGQGLFSIFFDANTGAVVYRSSAIYQEEPANEE